MAGAVSYVAFGVVKLWRVRLRYGSFGSFRFVGFCYVGLSYGR